MKSNDDLLAKCDVVLDINDPEFAEKLVAAIGAKPGEVIEFATPQFERTDGMKPDPPLFAFDQLPSMPAELLRQIGCQKWSEPDVDGNVLWLYPAEWYNYIPDGTPIVYIDMDFDTFKRGETDDDMRFGALAYGFLTRVG